VLDIGCGQERPLSKILTGGAATHVNHYTGVDLNKLKPSDNQRLTLYGGFNVIERYRELLKARKGSLFDVVVHLEVIEHMRVEHGRKLLKTCYEVLKPGGIMLMSTPCYDGKRHAANHIHEYTVSELQKAVEKAGFKVAERFGTFMDIKELKHGSPAVREVAKQLSEYFDNDAISNIFGPLFPDRARNNLWVCKKETSRGH
jgi:cyclopropane fatty-acyl-phospholipid synthase-like methyltransferase